MPLSLPPGCVTPPPAKRPARPQHRAAPQALAVLVLDADAPRRARVLAALNAAGMVAEGVADAETAARVLSQPRDYGVLLIEGAQLEREGVGLAAALLGHAPRGAGQQLRLVAHAACAKAGRAKAGGTKLGRARAGGAKDGEAKAGEAKVGEAKVGEAKVGEEGPAAARSGAMPAPLSLVLARARLGRAPAKPA